MSSTCVLLVSGANLEAGTTTAGRPMVVAALREGIAVQARELVADAIARLEACPAVYEHFHLEPSPKVLIFKSGFGEPVCRRTNVAAFTTVDGVVVWLCPRMNAILLQDPVHARMYLTHEILHAHGLREAPHFEDAPDSYEINVAIGRLCRLD